MDKLTSILLVDDDPTTNFVNQMLLEDLEVTQNVYVALNGREALDLIRQKSEEGDSPQLILLDINMPVMNGFEFLEAYAEMKFANKKSVVILMLTTSMNPKDVDRLEQKSINGYLNKPLTEQMIKTLISQYFSSDPV